MSSKAAGAGDIGESATTYLKAVGRDLERLHSPTEATTDSRSIMRSIVDQLNWLEGCGVDLRLIIDQLEARGLGDYDAIDMKTFGDGSARIIVDAFGMVMKCTTSYNMGSSYTARITSPRGEKYTT